MKIQARQSILDMWQAFVGYSYGKESTWNWGGRREPNCISDAEQLLVLLYPAVSIPSLKLDAIRDIEDDVRDSLRLLGANQPIPLAILRGAKEYLDAYRDDSGNPTFAGGSYFQAPRGESDAVARQRGLDVVDAYSMSITLCLAVIGFAKVFRSTLTRESLLKEVAEVEALASQRLTAAMVGLLRSFTVHTFGPDSESGTAMLSMVNQTDLPRDQLVEQLNGALDEVWVGLRESLAEGLTETQRQLFDDFEASGRLFECGWSWGVVDGTPPVSYAQEQVPHQPDGVAEARPYTYFTVTALDGIADLFNDRTRTLGLLSVHQQRLARALQNRLDLTRQYWATIATFGPGRWPLEDLPWKATDGSENDYHSLLLSAIVSQGLIDRRGATPALRRVNVLLQELAARAKITRRQVGLDDPAVALHIPGMVMDLRGSEKIGEEALQWVVSSFSMLLMKQIVQLAALTEDSVERTSLLQLADTLWEHLQRRRLDFGRGQELWDSPGNVYESPHLEPAAPTEPSWYHTERVMEALVRAALTVGTESTPGPGVSSVAEQVLAEAENVFDRELLRGDRAGSSVFRAEFREIQARLRRSRDLLASHPGTSLAQATSALVALDELVAARQGAGRAV